MSKYQSALTLSDDNQFSFICPIFDVQTKMAACMTLRELVWRGEKPAVRKGCQVCMHANKCPVNTIIWDMIRSPGNDPYGSETPKVGKLQERHLAAIERVKVPDKMIERAMEQGLPPAEVAKIRKSNDMAAKTASKHIRNAQEIALEDVQIDRRKRPPTETVMAPEISAAITGDMSAAVNAAMEERSKQ